MLLSSVVSLSALGVSTPAAPRTWTDREGRTVDAELVRADTHSVVIRRLADGREFTFPLERLSAADRDFVSQHLVHTPPDPVASGAPGTTPATPSAASAPWVDALNTTLGLPLFSDAQLWDDAPAELARRLQLTPESSTPGFESWRRFFRSGTDIAGAPAYMLSLRASDNRLAEFSILFTNRGDYPAFAGREAWSIIPADALAEFRTRLAADFETIRGRLAVALPEREIATTPSLRRAFPGELAVFLVGEHQLVLQHLPEWHLALRLQPAEGVAGPRLSDDRLRQQLRARITRRDTGDVVLDRIPMVDQGPKGYCVPATFERLLRYSGIEADMYDLAALGGTGFGGGTNVTKLVSALERTVRRHGRKLEALDLKLTPSGLARYVDEGRPVLWSLSSTAEFNALANAYSRERAQHGTTEALKSWAASQKRLGEVLRRDSESAHLCLLIGYNRSTGELAFSDSWGPSFAERWLPASAVQAVSAGQFWALDY